MALGTQNQLIEAAERQVKEAQQYKDECGRAQAGTPLGDNYSTAARQLEAAERNLIQVRNANRT